MSANKRGNKVSRGKPWQVFFLPPFFPSPRLFPVVHKLGLHAGKDVRIPSIRTREIYGIYRSTCYSNDSHLDPQLCLSTLCLSPSFFFHIFLFIHRVENIASSGSVTIDVITRGVSDFYTHKYTTQLWINLGINCLSFAMFMY